MISASGSLGQFMRFAALALVVLVLFLRGSLATGAAVSDRALLGENESWVLLLPVVVSGSLGQQQPTPRPIPTPNPLLARYAAPPSHAGCTVTTNVSLDGIPYRRREAVYNELSYQIESETRAASDLAVVERIVTEFDTPSELPWRISIDNSHSSAIGLWDGVSTYTYSDAMLVRVDHDLAPIGSVNYIEEIEYDSGGRMLLHSEDSDADGSWDRLSSYRYDEDGQIEEKTTDQRADGLVETVVRYYRLNGLLVGKGYDYRQIVDGEHVPPDGIDDAFRSYHYNARRQLVLDTYDTDADGAPEQLTRHIYDSTGFKSRVDRFDVIDGEEKLDMYVEYVNDSVGRPTWIRTVQIGLATTTQRVHYECGSS
jgi:hypothetical protein